MRVYLESYGCTLNRADAKIIEGIACREGAKIVTQPQDADVIILNTCAVKLPTERRMIERIRLFGRMKARLVP